MTEQLILVTGGTGMTGSRIAHRLRARDVPVRVASRSSAGRLDWADPITWDAALAGASAVYLAYAPDLAVPGSDDVVEPFVDADDIAEVAVTALLDDGHAGRTYELTGPRALGFGAAVAEIAAATGRPVAFRPMPLEEFTAGLAEEGAPPEVVELMVHLFTEVLDGRNAAPADGVQQALGRPATDLTDAVRRSALAGSRA